MIKKYISNSNITIIFPSTDDDQYEDFNRLLAQEPSFNIKVTGYDDFIQSITNNDFIVTIDSLALHIAEKYKKFSLALFSSSSPFALNITDTSYPFSRALDCCPCSHRYFIPPCKNKMPCTNIDVYDIEHFFSKLQNQAS